MSNTLTPYLSERVPVYRSRYQVYMSDRGLGFKNRLFTELHPNINSTITISTLSKTIPIEVFFVRFPL